MNAPSYLAQDGNNLRLLVHLQPGASRSKIAGIHGNALKIAIQAPPVEGKANAALVEFLADIFDLAKKNIQLLKGEKSREKTLLLQNITLPQALAIIDEALQK